MADWQRYTELVPRHTVVGDLRIRHDIHSPQLDHQRNVFVWLPASYASSDRRYPVLYMHDGDNLFDALVSYSGEWRVDETMTALSQEGYEAIIVGLPNAGTERASEYDPYPDYAGRETKGKNYIRFLVDTIKPMIDAEFRTLPDVSHTGIAGSSMGGLISLYGFLTEPKTFGFCGAFSTAYWFGFSGLVQTIQEHANGHGKIYLDVGTQEGATLDYWMERYRMNIVDTHAEYVRGVRELRDELQKQGYTLGENLRYIEDEGAIHREEAWAKRLPDALRFLLPKG
ncbi:MAG: alpha/beta hydrolase [Anaerolineae bacterium]|nr:alpha/beta hydrolase [Anaerolineae bacterium]